MCHVLRYWRPLECHNSLSHIVIHSPRDQFHFKKIPLLNPYCTGGGGGGGPGRPPPPPPPSTFSEIAPQPLRILNCRFYDFFPSSLTHILIPFSSKSDIPVRRYITISMRMSSKKKKKIKNHIKICINYHY